MPGNYALLSGYHQGCCQTLGPELLLPLPQSATPPSGAAPLKVAVTAMGRARMNASPPFYFVMTAPDADAHFPWSLEARGSSSGL